MVWLFDKGPKRRWLTFLQVFMGRDRYFSFLYYIQNGSGALHSLQSRGKVYGDTVHSPPSSAKDTNVWSIISMPPLWCYGIWLGHRATSLLSQPWCTVISLSDCSEVIQWCSFNCTCYIALNDMRICSWMVKWTVTTYFKVLTWLLFKNHKNLAEIWTTYLLTLV